MIDFILSIKNLSIQVTLAVLMIVISSIILIMTFLFWAFDTVFMRKIFANENQCYYCGSYEIGVNVDGSTMCEVCGQKLFD